MVILNRGRQCAANGTRIIFFYLFWTLSWHIKSCFSHFKIKINENHACSVSDHQNCTNFKCFLYTIFVIYCKTEHFSSVYSSCIVWWMLQGFLNHIDRCMKLFLCVGDRTDQSFVGLLLWLRRGLHGFRARCVSALVWALHLFLYLQCGGCSLDKKTQEEAVNLPSPRLAGC